MIATYIKYTKNTEKQVEKEEKNHMKERTHCYIPLTIERKLKAYSESPDHIERHEILWHEWNHNKRWLTQVQELILPSFPSYSRHDSSHSEAIIHNIEMLLGEENIDALSATDCFAILHTVYVHDIGMCITHADREQIINNKKFYEYLYNLCESPNSDLSSYAQILLRECFKKEGTDEEQLQYILESKLKVYYAVTYLLAEFRRREHGAISEKRLNDWVDNPEKLGIGFSTIDIPNRIFYVIGSCAAAHTKWGFDEILKLKQEDTGFTLDSIHPRFIAVLLQLGDALDMDNNRFHPLTEEFLGKMPKESSAHWKKHKAIRRLRITNEKISISADCKNQDELRLVRMECDTIQDILKNATFYWSVIKPKESKACLPTIDQTNLLLNGKSISPELVEAQFEIAQEKAFELLIGNNIYTDQHFVFLRELLQNAVDATKIQYYREYKRRCRGEKYVELKKEDNDSQEKDQDISPNIIWNKISPLDYPVVIELSVKRKLRNDKDEESFEDISEEELRHPEKGNKNGECGVLIKIRDCGTGISKEDIKQISNVGTSYEVKKEEIESMPKWLQPTGTFGIGLQSVFLATKVLKAYTHSTESVPYDITFYPRQEGKRGYINVMPRDIDSSTDPFGSCFEMFVPHTKKMLHKDNPETWDGEDPFTDGYEESRDIRHSRELLKQMALYLGEIVGEPLFPVYLYIKDCQSKEACMEFFNYDFENKMKNLKVYIGNADGIIKENKKRESKTVNDVTWAYNLEISEDTKGPDVDNNIYKLDSDTAKLYIWNQKYNTYARIGIDRILAIRDRMNAPDSEKLIKEKNGTKIYYKGILTAITEFEEDADLIEYMDIKDTLSREYLKLSRKGFSKKGYAYLEKIYHEIVRTARIALVQFGNKKVEDDKDSKKWKENTSIGRLCKRIEDVAELDKKEKLCLSAIALNYFAMVNRKNEAYSNEMEKNTKNLWTNLLGEIKKISMDKEKKTVLYNIPILKVVYANEKVDIIRDENEKTISVFDIIPRDNKYMILSKREGQDRHRWTQKLLKIDQDKYKEIKEKIRRLRSENSLSERSKIIGELEKIKEKYQTIKIEPVFEEADYLKQCKEEVILKWILDNIPTMAIFTWKINKNDKEKEEEFRLNILDVDICDSVYFDMGMKDLVLERIKEDDEKVQRCSVPVWSGFSELSLEESRDSIAFVKRGKLSKAGYERMIFPLTREDLRYEIDLCKEFIKEREVKIRQLVTDIGSISGGINVSGDKLNELKENIKKMLKNGDRESIFESIDMEEAQDKKEIDKKLKETKILIDEIKNYSNNLGERLYYNYCITDKESGRGKRYKNIKEFVHIYGNSRPTYETIDSLYTRYMYELAQVIIYMCDYRKELKEFLSKKEEIKTEEISEILKTIIKESLEI